MDRPDAGKDGRARSLISPAKAPPAGTSAVVSKSCSVLALSTRSSRPSASAAACASFGLAYGAAGVRAELLLL